MDMRTIQILENEKWIDINFEDLKTGDVFRMFESTGEPVVGDKGLDKWRVISTPYTTDVSGVYAIEVEDVCK